MSKILTRRIQKELEELSCTYLVHEFDMNSPSSIISITIEYDYDIYLFRIPKFYPFKPPILHINGMNIIELLHKYQKFLETIGIEKQLECICIKSLFCSNNWSPKIKIEDLIQEVQKEKRLIKHKYKCIFIKPLLIKNNIYENGILNTIISFYINI